MMVDAIMCCLPLPGKDDVVLFNGVLDYIGSCQHLLSMFFSVSLDMMDLCHMGSPLHLSIIHLRRRVLEGHQMSFDHPPYLGFKFHYPGEEPKHNGGTMPDRLGSLV